jgi:cytochrome c-type biogenesis protein CcmH|tara:strand:+ start:60237 stop:60659 length:423 start_codon:yes stop_codon:yes gene_type:complete
MRAVGKTLMLLLILLPSLAFSAIDVYQFDSVEHEQRFRGLIEQLRCPKCQNQSISDSDADIAQDMRAQVATMIREGRSNDEIVGYFTERYGDFVNYKPPVNAQTMILWAGPVLVFVIGFVLVLVQIRRAKMLAESKGEDA